MKSLPINQILCGDCLQILPDFPDRSIDLILCDLPYGVTQNQEDKPIDLKRLWQEYKRIIKLGGNIVLTSQFPFTLELIESNREWFRYDLIWNKVLVTGFLNANRQPLRIHEHILVFYETLKTYNPQKVAGVKNHGRYRSEKNSNYGHVDRMDTRDKLGHWKHPKSILEFEKDASTKLIHPTQKPVELFSFLIKSYSNEGDIVLDNCIGSGTTAVACKLSNRNFIGIDINPDYVELSLKRLENTPESLLNYLFIDDFVEEIKNEV